MAPALPILVSAKSLGKASFYVGMLHVSGVGHIVWSPDRFAHNSRTNDAGQRQI